MTHDSSSTTPPTVIVVGCGITGPVIALLLKQKGYKPIVVEKVTKIGVAGIGLGPAPNGIKVLDKVGLADKITDNDKLSWDNWTEVDTNGNVLADSQLPGEWKKQYGFPVIGCSRSRLQLTLKEALHDASIELREGWKLVDIKGTQDGQHVTAVSQTGEEIVGSFIVGADGIKSEARRIFLHYQGQEPTATEYTGLLLNGGISPTPAALKEKPGMRIVYGPGASLLVYPIEDGQSSWALYSRRDEEAIETWRVLDLEGLRQEKRALIQRKERDGWPPYVIQLINEAHTMISNGLYDRAVPDAEFWTFKRCVLIGDAAHPTSPHIGQGANSGLEDCYHLSEMLPDVRDGDVGLSTEELNDIFKAFARKRQPRTDYLVRTARTQGQMRTLSGGPEEIEQRNEKVREHWMPQNIKPYFDNIYNEPYKVDQLAT